MSWPAHVSAFNFKGHLNDLNKALYENILLYGDMAQDKVHLDVTITKQVLHQFPVHLVHTSMMDSKAIWEQIFQLWTL